MNCIAPQSKAFIFSRWVGAGLPIQYNIYSDKWPINTFDTTDSITSIADDNGFARITLSATVETYVNREYIKISGAAAFDGYDGVWQIIAVNSSTDITINAPFLGTDTGSFQRYYQGYYISAKVYAGIPSGHTHEAENPMTQVGTLRAKPKSDGNTVIDVTSYVKNELAPIKNNLCDVLSGGNGFMGNDFNLWTSFYIAYTESFLVSDGTTVTTFTDTYANDVDGPLGTEINYMYATHAALQFQDSQGRSIGRFVIADTDPDTAVANFMTTYETPTLFEGKEFDLAIGIGLSNTEISADPIEYVLTQYDSSGTLIDIDTSEIDKEDQGVYRFAFSEFPLMTNAASATFYLKKNSGTVLTEVKEFVIDTENCKRRGDIYLRWLNIYGGFDGWWFNRNHDYKVNVSNRQVVRRNIYKDFDDEFISGDTQDDYVQTTAKEAVVVRSQYMTDEQAEQMKWLVSSNKVYLCFSTTEEGCSRYKKRTVLIRPEEFTILTDRTKLNKISFTFDYTDELILPGQ